MAAEKKKTVLPMCDEVHCVLKGKEKRKEQGQEWEGAGRGKCNA